MYDPSRPSVEAVLDSSRYFVVRVEGDGKKAYIGMGFTERSESFDFSRCSGHTECHPCSLQPQTSHCRTIQSSRSCLSLSSTSIEFLKLRRFRAKQNPTQPDQTPASEASGPKKDYSLKEGQTFSIKLPGRSTVTDKSLLNAKSSSGSSSGGVPLLPPPPSVKRP